MKVAFYLTNNRNMRDGVTHYATEIINRLPKEGNIEFVGEAFLSYRDDKTEVGNYFSKLTPDLPLRLVKKFLPMRVLHRFCEYALPVSYETLMHERADAHIFFHNFLPKCNMRGKKIVVIHDLTPVYGKNSRARNKALAMYRRTAASADLIFTDSEYSKGEILKYCDVPADKVVVNYCGIDHARFSAPVPEEIKRAVCKKYGIANEFLLFMGQARQNKNLENLLRAYALLPEAVRKDYSLVLANHTPALAELAEKLGISARAVLLGGVEEEDVVPLYRSARGLALVSVSEGFGLPLVEAMTAGIPTVAADATCLPEIVGNASRLVDPNNPASIAEGLNEILTDETKRRELVALGKERALRYNWDDAAQKYYLALQSLL